MNCIKRLLLSYVVSGLCVVSTNAQLTSNYFEFSTKQNISVNGINLLFPWAGGLNAANLGNIDVDLDGILDVAIYDKTTNKFSVFLSKNGSLFPAPHLDSRFPKPNSWVVFADYNCDGKMDLFTNDDFNYIKIFKNVSSQTSLRWEAVPDNPKSKNSIGIENYIQSGPVSYPSITDIDDDGDIDIVVYNSLGVSALELFRNNAKETLNRCDTLVFEKYSSCWGKFTIGFNCNSLVSLNQQCPGYGGTTDNARMMHNGSAINILDIDGDGKKDALLGDVSCDNLYALYNSGSNLKAIISTTNPSFLSDNNSKLGFPVTFYVDADGDGVKDLVKSANVFGNDEFYTDFSRSLFYFKNSGTNAQPSFGNSGQVFLQDNMLDVGENAFPALADYDADGDLDLFVGNRGKLHSNNKYYATIYLFKNIGNKDSSSFLLETDDYLGLSSGMFTYIKPSFAKIDNNESPDLYFYAKDSSENRESYINFILNTKTDNSAFVFDKNAIKNFQLDLYIRAPYIGANRIFNFSPNYNFQVIRIEDSLKLLAASPGGRIQLYKNISTDELAPHFVPQFDSILGITPEDGGGFLNIITYFKTSDSLKAFVANGETGEISVFDHLTKNTISLNNNTATSNIIYNKTQNTLSKTGLGQLIYMAAGDLDNDSIPDLVVGTGNGGLYLLMDISKSLAPKDTVIIVDPPLNTFPGSVTGIQFSDNSLKIYPNPAQSSVIYIESSVNTQLDVFDAMGTKILANVNIYSDNVNIVDISSLKSGLYYIKSQSLKRSKPQKLVVSY